MLTLKLSILVFIPFLFIAGSFAQEIKPLILNNLIEEALTNNPQLKAYYHAAEADAAKIPQAGSLPDPVLSLNAMNLPADNLVFDQEPMTGKQVAVMQKFPFPGKLGLQEHIAEKNREVSNAEYCEMRNQLVQNVRMLYYDLYYADKSIATTKKNQSLLNEFVKIAETKYSVGKGLQQDVLKAQVELSRMTDRLITLKQKREQLEAKLNAMLNRPVTQPLGPTIELQDSVHSFNHSQMEKIVADNRPLLKVWQSRADQSGEQISLARKNYWPDFTLSLAYTQRDVLQNGSGGVDFLSGGISLNVPLYFWRKQGKMVEEKKLLKNQADENYLNIKNQVMAELDNALTGLDKNAEQLELYKTGIIPQATQSLQSAIIGYQTDKVDFLTLVNNQLTLFSLELEYTRILSEYYKNLAQLDFIAGINL